MTLRVGVIVLSALAAQELARGLALCISSHSDCKGQLDYSLNCNRGDHLPDQSPCRWVCVTALPQSDHGNLPRRTDYFCYLNCVKRPAMMASGRYSGSNGHRNMIVRRPCCSYTVGTSCTLTFPSPQLHINHINLLSSSKIARSHHNATYYLIACTGDYCHVFQKS